MSDLLTHWAVFDDCRRLALSDPQIEPLLAETMHEQREFARLGAISRAGSLFVPHILRRARAAWDDDSDREMTRRRLAFALGGITHYAADAVMKPLMSERARADWHEAHRQMANERSGQADTKAKVSVREVSAYYDVYVFRKVYLAGQEEPFSRFLLAPNAASPGAALEEFVRALFQWALLSSHTLAPDREDLDGWLDHLLNSVQPLYVAIDCYCRIFERPDPEKMATYGVETVFYVEGDPVIRLARAVQASQGVSDADFSAALADDANRSAYARALVLGMTKLREASAWWQGRAAAPPDIRQ